MSTPTTSQLKQVVKIASMLTEVKLDCLTLLKENVISPDKLSMELLDVVFNQLITFAGTHLE